MKKIIGYLFALIGLAGVAAYAIPQVRAQIPLPEQISDTILIIISAAILLLGIFFVVRSGGGRSKKGAEVPIYSGKNIVGYRRT